MGYRKSVKGDSNQANEEFSHNRITIEAGNAGVLFVAFLIVLIGSMIIWLVVNFGNLLAITVLSLLLVAAGGGIWLLGVFIYTRSGIMLSERRRARNHERLIESGEVSFYLQPLTPDFTVYASSAEHNRALVAPVQVKELPSPDPRWDAVLDLRKEGKGMHQIAKDLNVPYNRVRQFLNQVEKNNSET